MGVVPALAQGGNRHRRARLPHFGALRRAQPGELGCIGRQPVAHPRQHVVERAADATRRRGGDLGDEVGIRAGLHVAPVDPRMRLRHAAGIGQAEATDPASGQAQGREQFATDKLLVRRPARCGRHLPGNHVQQVVVGIAGAEPVGRRDVAQAADDVVAGEQVGLRPQHQVAAALRQAAVVHQQVAHRHVAGDPRVVHGERRQVLHHRVVPIELALLDQARQHGGGHRLAVRRDLEQRRAGHRLAAAGHRLAMAAGVHHLAIGDHADRDAGQLVARDGRAHRRIDRLGAGRGGWGPGNCSVRQRQRHQQQGKEPARSRGHAVVQSVEKHSPAIIASKSCRRRTSA